jgi:hypothetical protein
LRNSSEGVNGVEVREGICDEELFEFKSVFVTVED